MEWLWRERRGEGEGKREGGGGGGRGERGRRGRGRGEGERERNVNQDCESDNYSTYLCKKPRHPPCDDNCGLPIQNGGIQRWLIPFHHIVHHPAISGVRENDG